MEMVYYKCPLCGFTYQVPEYWSGYSPEGKIEMPHYNIETKNMCSEVQLTLV